MFHTGSGPLLATIAPIHKVGTLRETLMKSGCNHLQTKLQFYKGCLGPRSVILYTILLSINVPSRCFGSITLLPQSIVSKVQKADEVKNLFYTTSHLVRNRGCISTVRAINAADGCDSGRLA